MAKQTPKAETPATQDQQTEPVPLAEPEGGWPADEFTGRAGSYVRDPYTGIRRPAEEPDPTNLNP